MIERIAHAKINLALHVTGQRDDGYHLLDSVVVFTLFGDIIRVEEPHHAHGPIEVNLYGPFGGEIPSGADNIITAAAVLLREAVKRNGQDPAPVAINLTKNLPVASGIGGGSADAAATLQALQEYWNSNVDLEPIAVALGADVLMCLHSKPLRARGIGDEIDLLRRAEKLNLLLINPGRAVSTPTVFSKLKNKCNSPLTGIEEGNSLDVSELGKMRNDLETPAREIAPEISLVLSELAATDARLARMSGSGATCFAIFETIEEAESVQSQLQKSHPDWWSVASVTTIP